MADVQYEPHARDRMEERGVSEQDVELALKRPIGAPRPGQPGTIWIDGYGMGNRVIPVCVLTANHNHVKTVGWPREGGPRR